MNKKRWIIRSFYQTANTVYETLMKQLLSTTLNQRIMLQKGIKAKDHSGSYNLIWQNHEEIWGKIYPQQKSYCPDGKYVLNEISYLIVTNTMNLQALGQSSVLLRIQYKDRLFTVSAILYHGDRCVIKSSEMI